MKRSIVTKSTKNRRPEKKQSVVSRLGMPTTAQLERELKREKYKRNYAGVLRSTVYTLVTVAAAAVLVAVLLMPVLRIYGRDRKSVV